MADSGGGSINLDSPAAPTSTAGGGGWNPYTTEQTQAAKQAKDADANLNDATVNPIRTKAADKKLQAHMRLHNKYETTFEMMLMGDLCYIAGSCVTVDKTFGKFEGKYILEEVRHDVGRGGKGFQCQVKAHKCLDGY